MTQTKQPPENPARFIALFVPFHQRLKVKRAERFDLLERHRAGRVYPEDLARTPGKYVVLFRESLLGDLERAACLDGARAVWSQWSGYLKEPKTAALLGRLKSLGVPYEVIHTSGHASIGDLQELARKIAPRSLTPIHTFEPDRYPSLFENVVLRRDGEWWEI